MATRGKRLLKWGPALAVLRLHLFRGTRSPRNQKDAPAWSSHPPFPEQVLEQDQSTQTGAQAGFQGFFSNSTPQTAVLVLTSRPREATG